MCAGTAERAAVRNARWRAREWRRVRGEGLTPCGNGEDEGAAKTRAAARSIDGAAEPPLTR